MITGKSKTALVRGVVSFWFRAPPSGMRDSRDAATATGAGTDTKRLWAPNGRKHAGKHGEEEQAFTET